MSSKERDFPWRVLALSVALAAALGLLLWWAGMGQDGRPVAEPGEAAETGERAPGEPGPDAEAGSQVKGRIPPVGPAGAGDRRPDQMTVRLFLLAPGRERLVSVERTVEAPPTLAACAHRALEELVGWRGSEMASPLPPETVVREVWLSPGNVAYVDLGEGIRTALAGGSLAEIHAVYGIVHTVTASFPEIRAVQILVGGQQVDTLLGHLDLARPLLPSREWVAGR